MVEEKFTAEQWGRKMAKARADSLTAKERKDIAAAAIKVRWEKYYAANPDKLKARLERDKAKAIAAKAKARKKKAGK